jgi:hypothetical protein
VSNYLKLDYRLAGGIAVARERVSGPLKYCQAVVKADSEAESKAWNLSTQIKRKRGRPPKVRTTVDLLSSFLYAQENAGGRRK